MITIATGKDGLIHSWPKQLGKERVYLAYTSTSLIINEESRAGTQTGQEPWGRSWCRATRSAAHCLLHVGCSACFLIEHKITSPGMALHTMAWALLHQSLIKKIPYRLSYSPIILNWSSAVSSDSSLCQVNIKLASTASIATILDNIHRDKKHSRVKK